MIARPERPIQLVAWGVLAAAFAAFLVLAVGGPFVAWRVAHGATSAQRASVRARVGNVGVSAADRREILGEGDAPAEVREGARLTLLGAGGSSAFVRFFDGSTAMLERHGELTLEAMRRPRFAFGDGPPRIALLLADDGPGATLTLSTPYDAPDHPAAEVVVSTTSARVTIGPDARVRFSLDAGALRVAVDVGEAWVEAPLDGGATPALVRVGRGARTFVPIGRIPSTPTDALEELVHNGDFNVPPRRENGWSRVPPSGPRPVAPPTMDHEIEPDGRTALRLQRVGAEKSPADIVLRQDLDVDLRDATNLGLEATLRIDAQSLPGGGDNAQEYPLILTLVAEDANGDEFAISARFFALAPDPAAAEFAGARVEPDDVRVPLGAWFSFDSGELRDGSSPLARARIPVRLRRLEVKASGHDFDTRLDRVSVLWK